MPLPDLFRTLRRHVGYASLAPLAVLFAAQASVAAPPPLSVPISSQDASTGAAPVSTGLLSDLQRSDFLLGDLFGLRRTASRFGISIAIQETSEVLGNATGGVHRGADYDGLTQAIVQLDTQRAFGWYGGLFNISALQIHGRNLSADNLLTLQTASGIEADRSTRLWELWFDQKFLDEDRADIKVGQQSADQEFITSTNGAYFLNTMFGWPTVPSYDLPGGGPAYPLSAPAIRLRYRPTDSVTALLGVFSGSPANSDQGDPQRVDASGTSFPLREGPLVFAELQYNYPALGAMVYPGEGAPLGHIYKIGVWYDDARFSDESVGANGRSLAAPNSMGVPAPHHGDFSIYATADQMIWRDQAYPNRSVSVFARAMGTPQGDRNLVDFSANAGIVYHDPIHGRPDDTAGFGFGYAHVSSGAQAYDRAAAAYNAAAPSGSYFPVRSSETFLEATYQYQLYPWWQAQPDAQYVFRPGGSVTNPATGGRVTNEFVLGLRTNILF
jgi:porin